MGEIKTRASWMEGMPTRVKQWPVPRLCLLHLLRTALGAAFPAALLGSLGQVDKTLLLRLIKRHRVGAFLSQRLPQELLVLLGPDFADELRRIALQNQMKALRQTATVVRLTKRFDDASLAVRCLKGPLLAQNLYGGQGVRHAGDIDLAIGESDVRQADDVLRDEGFERIHPPGELTELQWKKYTGIWRDCEYRHRERGVSVEMMWRLANHGGLQHHADESTEAQEISGYPVRALPAAVHGVYLLVHGAHHGWFRLFWLVDIALLMGDETVDWEAMRLIAVSAGVERPFWQGLHLARQILGAPWPSSLKEEVPDAAVDSLIDDAYWQLELTPHEIRFGMSHVRKAAYARRLFPDRQMQRLERAKRWINPADWQLVPLPDRWFWLYYLIWPVLWLWRQGARRLSAHDER